MTGPHLGSSQGEPLDTGAGELPDGSPPGSPGKRPILERLGLAVIAIVLGALFGGMAVAAFIGGELFLAVMAGIGCGMTLWVGALTLIRG